MFAMDKNSSLVKAFVNYARKKYFKQGPWSNICSSGEEHLKGATVK
jgi:hypothetical protein